MKRFLLAAAVVSLPVTAALADYDRGGYGYDEIHTSSVAVAAASFSNAGKLDSSLRAAETNLDALGESGVRPDVEIRLRSEIRDIRNAAVLERQSNGGELSEASFRQLSDRLSTVQRSIYNAR